MTEINNLTLTMAGWSPVTYMPYDYYIKDEWIVERTIPGGEWHVLYDAISPIFDMTVGSIEELAEITGTQIEDLYNKYFQ